MFSNLIVEFLNSKRKKDLNYRKDFVYFKYNDILEQIFDVKDEKLFEKIIGANKKEIDKYIINYKEYLNSQNIEFQSIEKMREGKKRNKVLKALLSLHNTYENFASEWNEKIVDAIGTRTCLYCNREYVIKYSNKTTAELDHFYPRSLYPFLSISFYNLIPSCKNCNSKFKGDADTFLPENRILYPYAQKLNDNMSFKLNIKDSSFLHDKDGFKIDIKTKNDESKESKKLFKLDELYQEHKDIVLELIQKREIYPASYIDELFTQYEGTLFKNREDVLRLITGGYIEGKDLDKRPLSKLIKDISEELEF